MKKNSFFVRILSLFLCIIIGVSPLRVYAESDDASIDIDAGIYGRLPVNIIGGGSAYLEVFVHEGFLYVKSKSFAKAFGYTMADTEDSVQFLQEENTDEDYKWTLLSSFEINSTAVWLSDGEQLFHYMAPVETIKNDEVTWIPLQFALKIMGRELYINNGVIIVSSAHESGDMLINNVKRTESDYFKYLIVINQIFEGTRFRTYPSPLLTEALAAESEKNQWLYKAVDKSIGLGKTSSDALNELATYLVSNLAAENYAMYSSYYELLQMYFGTELMLAGMDVLGRFLESDSDEINLEKEQETMENVVASCYQSNSDTIQFNEAFHRAYTDLTGYNPSKGEWSDTLVYEELLTTMIQYSGDPSEKTYETINYATSFLEFLGDASSEFGQEYVFLHCLKNYFAENDFASLVFEKYLAQVTVCPENRSLANALRERTKDYVAYQEELTERYREKAHQEMTENIRDSVENDLVTELFSSLNPMLGEGYGIVTDINSLQDDALEYQRKIQEINDKEFHADLGAFHSAKLFANEIAEYAISERVIEWAYLFYRTDYISNYYYYNALGSPCASQYISSDQAGEIRSLLATLMREDAYQLSAIRLGINYGLSEDLNEEYIAIYDDTPLLGFVEEVNLLMGNSNANINACGFVATSENHCFYVSSDDDYAIYMSERNGQNAKKIIKDGGHWLNTYSEDEKEYLFFIDSKCNICRYDVTVEKSDIALSGNYSQMMIVAGNICVIEKGNLYRIALIDAKNYGEKELIVSNVGETVVYDDDSIYYCDGSGQVFYTDYSGENVEALNISSTSFDISNGNLYYSNLEDGRRLYLYNILTGVSKKLSDTTDTYCISYYQGMVYFKIDDNRNSSMLYSVIPFVDRPTIRVYSWRGEDDPGLEMGESDTSYRHTSRRLFNISNGKIYNEGYTRMLVDFPLAGITWRTALGYVSYRISNYFLDE